MRTLTKRATAPGQDLRCEAAALRWLAEAESQGGIHVARVRLASSDELVEEAILPGSPSREGARAIGTALARTHAAAAPWWGCPPPAWPKAAAGYVIDSSLTPVIPSAKLAPSSWGPFFAEWRMEAYLRPLVDGGTIDSGQRALLERVASRVADGAFDAKEPALVERAISSSTPDAPVACARLHGDLWAGNVLWDGSSQAQTGGALIDPMAHGGHAESDLAMLALFGYPYLDDVIAAYDELSPLAGGWHERVGLHQLAPLLLHCVLFGGAYVAQTLGIARRYA